MLVQLYQRWYSCFNQHFIRYDASFGLIFLHWFFFFFFFDFFVFFIFSFFYFLFFYFFWNPQRPSLYIIFNIDKYLHFNTMASLVRAKSLNILIYHCHLKNWGRPKNCRKKYEKYKKCCKNRSNLPPNISNIPHQSAYKTLPTGCVTLGTTNLLHYTM